MSITTINTRPIAHKRNLDAEQKMFDATAQEMIDFCAECEANEITAYVLSNVQTLRFIAPVVDVTIVENFVCIIMSERVLTVDIAGMNRAAITRAMIAAVQRKGREVRTCPATV